MGGSNTSTVAIETTSSAIANRRYTMIIPPRCRSASHGALTSPAGELSSKRGDGPLQGGQSSPVHAVGGARPFDLTLNQPGFPQNPKMLGDGRLGER